MTALALAPMNVSRCWAAVLNRDRHATFVYAVRSTGIYCKPSCPSRRPTRSEVEFFSEPSDAEAAGFRACRRCRPATTVDPTAALAERVSRAIERHVDGTVDLAALAAAEGISAPRLRRVFQRATGLTPRAYAEATRMRKLRERLRSGHRITTAMYDSGLTSTSRLYERAPRVLGMTPRVYGKGGESERVRYTTTATPIGRMLVAATERGICAVSLGRTDAELEKHLAVEFPRAERVRNDGGLAEWVTAIVRQLEGHEPAAELPLDVRATAFQQQVWQALREIPFGATRSYAQIAQALGKPAAARAVARACAANPTALLIPCHRVVRGDGTMGGYKWGIERKRAILDVERVGSR